MNTPRRVLSLATLYPNAATPRFGTFVARQLEALADRGDWDVTVINPIGIPPIPFGRYKAMAKAAVYGVENGVTVHRPTFTLIPKLSAPFNPGLIASKVLPLARKLHAEHPFDLVDAQFFYPDGPAAARVAAALSLPLSIKARGADISHWGRLGCSRKAMLEAAGQAKGLLAVSEALADDMAALGMQRDKITIHYTGLDRARFRPLEREMARDKVRMLFEIDAGPSDPLLACVGALIPRKGQELAIRALGHFDDAHLLLVGTGSDRAKLKGLADDFGLASRVHFLGSLDHETLPLVLSACNAMVLPSESEGLANAWVEALACGTPLVITDAGGANELLRQEQAGRIVERLPGAIAGGISSVLMAGYDPAAVAATVESFSWEANAAQLSAYYGRLAG